MSIASRLLLLFSVSSFSSAAADGASWDACPNQHGGPYSPWNTTSCPSSSTCCGSGFNPSEVGCCPLGSGATCCGKQPGFTCCPAGNTCVHASGGGYGETFTCVPADGSANSTAASVCKSGPPLPMSTTKKNVLWIGDSLSLGMIPIVASNLSDIALVQHAPWGGDGGAEETAYGVRCLDYFLASPSGMDISPDLILFNWGMHDGPLGNDTTPGQNSPPDNYTPTLTNLTTRLVNFAARKGAKLVFVHTTPYLCSVVSNGCVQNLNNQADTIMKSFSIPIIDPCESSSN
jgi:hypothetical protein